MAPSTVPPDGMENTGCQGEAHKIPPAAAADDNTGDGQISEQRTFHRYVDLPYKIRKQIRTEAFMIPQTTCETPFYSWMAILSKEWNDEVEKILFREITINPLHDQEVSKFMEHFSTDRRRRFLTRLDIAINDSLAGPWHQWRGISEIAHLMGKIGKFLQYINTWDFRGEDGSTQTIELNFTTAFWEPWDHNLNDTSLFTMFDSFWRKSKVKFLTGDGEIPLDLPLEAIRSDFPSSLNMVTRLSFAPDFVPLPAARRIIQAMPNLEACHLEPFFDMRSGGSWTKLTSLIHQLHISAPSLRSLTLGNSKLVPDMKDYSDEMIEFAVILRQYSQRLESLRAHLLPLDREFFFPWSDVMLDIDPNFTITPPSRPWCHLKYLDLLFLDDDGMRAGDEGGGVEVEVGSTEDDVESVVDDESAPDDQSMSELGPDWKRDSNPKRDRLRFSPADILMAAGGAATDMSQLVSARVAVTSGHAIFVKRKLRYAWVGGKITSRFCLTGCSETEQRDILWRWHFFLGDRKLDPDLKDEFFDLEPCRTDFPRPKGSRMHPSAHHSDQNGPGATKNKDHQDLSQKSKGFMGDPIDVPKEEAAKLSEISHGRVDDWEAVSVPVELDEGILPQ